MMKNIMTHNEFMSLWYFSNHPDNDNMLHMITGISYVEYYMLTGFTTE